MKRVLNFIAAIVTVILMISCNQENNINTNEEINATMISPDGLPSIAISKLITDNSKFENITLECSIQKTTDLLLSELMKGEADLAIVPSNLALQAYKKYEKIHTKQTNLDLAKVQITAQLILSQ